MPRSVAALLFIHLLFAAAVAESQPTYQMDNDPIKLGTKALEQGKLDEARTRFEEARAAGYRLERAADGLGRIKASEGRLSEAETLFREAIELRKGEGKEFPEARAALGLLLLRTGRSSEAGMEFDLALAADGDLWPAIYGRGRMLLEAGELEAARKLFDKGATRKGAWQGEDLHHHGLALCHLRQDDLTAAESEALVAAALVPGDPDYALLLATIYERKNIPALALGAYEKVLAAPGQAPTAPLLHAMGGLYQRLSRFNEARDSYLKAVQVDSTFAPAFRDLGDLFRRARQFDRAELAYRRYLDLVPGDVAVLVALAETDLELGKPLGALEAADRALAADSSSARARSIRTRAGLRSMDKAVRIEATRRFAAQPDTVGWTVADWAALATGQADAGDDAAAEKSLRQLLARQPESAESWFQFGLLDLNAGRPDSSRVRFEKSIAIKPDAPLTWLNLGIALFQARKTREAIPAFRQAVALDERVPMGRLLLAQALAVSDSLRAAEEEYGKVLAAEPGNPRALRGVAYCQIRNGRYSDAARSYEAATRAEPGNADGWAGLGNAYLGLSRLDASEEAFRKARAIDPGNVTMKKGMELLEQARAAAPGGG